MTGMLLITILTGLLAVVFIWTIDHVDRKKQAAATAEADRAIRIAAERRAAKLSCRRCGHSLASAYCGRCGHDQGKEGKVSDWPEKPHWAKVDHQEHLLWKRMASEMEKADAVFKMSERFMEQQRAKVQPHESDAQLQARLHGAITTNQFLDGVAVRLPYAGFTGRLGGSASGLPTRSNGGAVTLTGGAGGRVAASPSNPLPPA